MADSYILQVEKAVTSHILDTIEGYDLTNAVWRARGRIGGRGSNEPLPAVSLIQAPEVEPETIEAGRGEVRMRQVLYFIQGWADIQSHNNQTDEAHNLMAAVKKCLAPIMQPPTKNNEFYHLRSYNPNGNDLIESLELGIGLVRPPDDEVSPNAAYFWLPIRLGLVESPADPYALP